MEETYRRISRGVLNRKECTVDIEAYLKRKRDTELRNYIEKQQIKEKLIVEPTIKVTKVKL